MAEEQMPLKVVEADLKEENKLAGKWIAKAADGSESGSGDWSEGVPSDPSGKDGRCYCRFRSGRGAHSDLPRGFSGGCRA